MLLQPIVQTGPASDAHQIRLARLNLFLRSLYQAAFRGKGKIQCKLDGKDRSVGLARCYPSTWRWVSLLLETPLMHLQSTLPLRYHKRSSLTNGMCYAVRWPSSRCQSVSCSSHKSFWLLHSSPTTGLQLSSQLPSHRYWTRFFKPQGLHWCLIQNYGMWW